MGYTLKKNTRIDLSALGTDSAGSPFFVEVFNTKMMNYEDRQVFANLGKNISAEEGKERIQSLKAVVTKLIISWNLISLDDEMPLNIPSLDETSFDKVPGEALDMIFKNMAVSMGAEDKATKNSLPQSDKSSENDRLQETSTSDATTN